MLGLSGVISNHSMDTLKKFEIKSKNKFNEYRSEYYQIRSYHLGRLDSFTNTADTPSTFCLVYGDFFSFKNLEANNITNPAIVLIADFEKNNTTSFSSINGQFQAFIYDKTNHASYIISDRFGTKPIYFRKLKKDIFFSTQVSPLIKIKETTHNYSAYRQLFHFGHLVDDHTLHTEINQIPPSSYLKFQDGNCSIHQYWDIPYYEEAYSEKKYSKAEINNLCDELIHHQFQAVKRQTHHLPNELLFSLSGGLDSRWIASVASNLNIPFKSYTMGHPYSEDIKYAKQITDVIGANHSNVMIKPEEIWSDSVQFSKISGGMYLLNGPLPVIQSNRKFSDQTSIVVSAQFADMIWGSTLKKNAVKTLINSKLDENTFKRFQYTMFKRFDLEQFQPFLNQEFYSEVLKAKFDPFKNSFEQLRNKPTIHTYFYNTIRDYARRCIFGGNIAINITHEIRMPSFDNDLLDFALRAPLSLKKKQYLYRKAFSKKFPSVANIPKTGDHLPINASNFQISYKDFASKLRGRLKKIGFINQYYSKQNRNLSYVNYNLWMKKLFYKDINTLFNSIDNQQLLNREKCIELLNIHKKPNIDYSLLLWQLINLCHLSNSVDFIND